MKVSRRWIEWAHGPGAEDGQPLATSLCELASVPGSGSILVGDPALIAELVDVRALRQSVPGRRAARHGAMVDGAAAPDNFRRKGFAPVSR